MSNNLLGIDLGTTNSCAYAYCDGKIDIVESAQGNRTIPSVITIEDDEIIVGEFALQNMMGKNDNTVYAIKRLIGLSYKEYNDNELTLFYYEIVNNNGNCGIKIEDKIYTPEEISSFILKEIKNNAEKKFGSEFKKAVITVPAYFNNEQRNSTIKAGELAGLEVIKIINEPTAASISYTEEMTSDEKLIMVYDLGGGTFDVSLVYMDDSNVDVEGSSGNNFLGGEDFDSIIMMYIAEKMGITSKIESSDIEKSKFLKICENAKKTISVRKKVKVSLDDNTYELTREEVETLLFKKLNETFEISKKLLEENEKKESDVDYLIFVGGSTKLQYLKDLANKRYDNILSTISVDEVVAKGALTHGISLIAKNSNDKQLKETSKRISLADVTPFNLGLELDNGDTAVIIPKNSGIPMKKTKRFQTVDDDQEEIELNIIQGNKELATDNHSIGRAIIDKIPMKEAGKVSILIQFKININGTLEINANIEETDIKKDLIIEMLNKKH